MKENEKRRKCKQNNGWLDPSKTLGIPITSWSILEDQIRKGSKFSLADSVLFMDIFSNNLSFTDVQKKWRDQLEEKFMNVRFINFISTLHNFN